MMVMDMGALGELHAHAEYFGKKLCDLQMGDLRDELRSVTLIEDMGEHGQYRPVELSITEAGEMSLRDGHHRYIAARTLGWKNILVKVVNY